MPLRGVAEAGLMARRASADEVVNFILIVGNEFGEDAGDSCTCSHT